MTNVRVNVKIEGLGRVSARVRKVDGKAGSATDAASKAMAEEMKLAVEEELSTFSGGGQTWNEAHPAFHPRWQNSYGRPSAGPGASPNTQTGGLIDSLQVDRVSDKSYNFVVNSPYARFHEFDGWTSWYGNSIGERPFVRPALESIRDELGPVAQAAFREALGV